MLLQSFCRSSMQLFDKQGNNWIIINKLDHKLIIRAMLADRSDAQSDGRVHSGVAA
jgi:hypothetical protein